MPPAPLLGSRRPPGSRRTRSPITSHTLAAVQATSAAGWFISLEGPEGSGKSTQGERLAALVRASGREVILTREPGGTGLGERIREALLERTVGTAPIDVRAEALLFDAARAQLVAEVIEPALVRGALVVCDRFADSTIAYQGFGGGLPVDELRAVEWFATGGRRPDLTILLDLPVDLGLARKALVEHTRFEDLGVAFHERVRAGFLALAAAEPNRWVVVDAMRDPDVVFEAVVAAVAERLPTLVVPAVRP
jgi:dTMP kinase